MAKRVSRIGSIGSFLNGSIGSYVESGGIDPHFSNKFFFFEIDAICQLFMNSLTVIRLSLVILLPITTKHLIPKFGVTLVLSF